MAAFRANGGVASPSLAARLADSKSGYPGCMTEKKRGRDDQDIAEGVLDADDTGMVRNETQIVEEEIEEGLSPEKAP